MKNNSKWRRIFRSILSLALLAFLLIGSALLVYNRDKLGSIGVLSWLFGSNNLVDERFVFDMHADNVYAELNGKLLVASATEIRIFDENGSELSSSGRAFSWPAVSGTGNKAVVWDIGGNAFTAVNEDGGMTGFYSTGILRDIHVNANGWFAVCAEETGYRGTVMVYNNSGNMAYRWYSMDGYAICAAVSPGNGHMTAVTLTGSGSRTVSFSLDNVAEEGSYVSADKLFFDIAYMSDSRICLVSENALTFLDGSSGFAGEYTFPDEYIKDYSLDGNGYVTLALGKYKTGNSGRIVTVDSGGNEIRSIDISTEIISMSAKSRYIAVAYADKLVIYTNDLNTRSTLEGVSGMRGVLMCQNGSVIIISSYGAAVYNP